MTGQLREKCLVKKHLTEEGKHNEDPMVKGSIKNQSKVSEPKWTTCFEMHLLKPNQGVVKGGRN